GKLIRLPIPDLNEERRRELVKQVKKSGEEYRISVRNERRDAMNALKELEKSKSLTEDDLTREKDRVQKLHDTHMKAVDEAVAAKEKELMQV
ncbi:MAG: ribosome-recycling factor, partial [Vicinamibacteria bacterium]